MQGWVQSGSNGGEQSSTIRTKCYIDASIPSEQQILAPTPAGIGIHVQNLLVPDHLNLWSKLRRMKVTDLLRAEFMTMRLGKYSNEMWSIMVITVQVCISYWLPTPGGQFKGTWTSAKTSLRLSDLWLVKFAQIDQIRMLLFIRFQGNVTM